MLALIERLRCVLMIQKIVMHEELALYTLKGPATLWTVARHCSKVGSER